MRLICFGDSWTAGHGVEDNVKFKEIADPEEGKWFIPYLRKFNSWPRWLSNKLDCPFVNRGYSGSGNHDMLKEINYINDDNLFEPTDIIIVMFSYPHRYRHDNDPKKNPIYTFEEMEKILKPYRHFYFNSFYPTFKDEEGFDTSTLPNYFINPNGCISDFLKDYEMKNDEGIWEYGGRSVYDDENNFWIGDYHPNLKGYKLLGEYIYEQIKDKL